MSGAVRMSQRLVLPANQVIGSAIRLRVQARVKGPVDSYNPEVVISYATSQRFDDKGNKIDDDGNGPGMFFLEAIVDTLAEFDIDSFSGTQIGSDGMRQSSAAGRDCWQPIPHASVSVLPHQACTSPPAPTGKCS